MTDGLRVFLLPLAPMLGANVLLGLVFGGLGWRERPAGFWGRLGLILAVVALCGGAVLALSGRVAGRHGLWLEIGLALVAAYLAGCLLGAVLRAVWRRAAGHTGSNVAG